jgi:hypothetical protein
VKTIFNYNLRSFLTNQNGTVFGTKIWPTAENGRTMYTIRQRIGPVTCENAEDIWLVIHCACIFAMFPSISSLFTSLVNVARGSVKPWFPFYFAGKIKIGGELTEKETVRARTLVSSSSLKFQVKNYLRKNKLKERREKDLREDLEKLCSFRPSLSVFFFLLVFLCFLHLSSP